MPRTQVRNSQIADEDITLDSLVLMDSANDHGLTIDLQSDLPADRTFDFSMLLDRIRLKATSTNATPVTLTTDGAAAGADNQLAIAGDSVLYFSGVVVGYATAGNQVAIYTIEGILKRPGSGAAGTVLLSGVVTTKYENVGTMTVDLAADATNGALQVTFTGASGYTVQVFADITYTRSN